MQNLKIKFKNILPPTPIYRIESLQFNFQDHSSEAFLTF